MTHSEQHVGSTLTDSLLHEIMAPGYLPDISALQVPVDGGATYSGPYLEILEQPKQRGFRFRYPCEGPSHGGLPGQFSSPKNKSYPSVQVCNYKGPCRIVVTLVTSEEPHVVHAHSLTGKNANDGVVTVQIGPEQGMTASFPNLGVQHVTRKMVTKVLMERYIQMQALHNATISAMSNAAAKGALGLDLPLLNDQGIGDRNRLDFDKSIAQAVADEEATKIRKIVDDQARSMNLSAVKLCFQAYLPDGNGNFTKALKPMYTVSVFDSKAPAASQLKICRMDKNSGCVTGGNEIYLLCDRVQRDDIELRFYECDDTTGKTSWEGFGVFSPSDVHRQFAIVFKTPPYWNVAIERPSNVMIELRRKSDGGVSDPVQFTYQPQVFDKEQIGAKRRKKVPHFSDYFPPGPSGAPGAVGGDGGGGGFFGFNLYGGLTAFGNLGGPSTSQQTQGGGSSGGTQHSTAPQCNNQPSEAMLKELAWALAEHASSAMRDYAATGDARYLLAVQRQLTAVQDDQGDTALHLAVINCQFEAIESLVSVMIGLPETFINEYNYLRQSPLHLAIITRQPLATDCLLRGRADATLRDRHGNTAVHIACAQGDVACLKVLLNSKLRQESGTLPELDCQNYEGFTPVHLGTLKGNKQILKLLNTSGADMEAMDGTCGRSPLHHAVETNNLAVAGFLILEAQCDMNLTTYDGNTPLHVAAGRGFQGQTALLVAAGADTKMRNNEEETPYDLASTAEVQQMLDDNVVLTDPASDNPGGVVAGVAGLCIGERTTNTSHEMSRHSMPGGAVAEKGLSALKDRYDSGVVEGDSGFGSQSVSAERSEDMSLPVIKRPSDVMRPGMTSLDFSPHIDHSQLVRHFQDVQ